MSWKDNIDNIKFSIQTGDGNIFYPLWRDSVKNMDFNVTGFDFIEVPGTLYERKQPRGANYTLSFFFTGDNFITDMASFEASANDRRPWTVTHPIYGVIVGQPTSIGRTDSLNACAVTVDFWESIDVDYPNTRFDVQDNTLVKKNSVMSSAAESYSSKPVFETEDIVKTKDRNTQVSSSFDEVITQNPLLADQYFSEYQNATSAAQNSADGLLSDSFNTIQQAQALVNLPARMEATVATRLDAFLQCYGKIKNILNTVADKVGFESNAAGVIANYAEASVNPIEGDYQTVPEVQAATNNLFDMYQDYLVTLDNASVGIYDVDNTFQPDALLQAQLYDLVMYTIANLYELAFEAQQERVIYTEKDTNVFLLCHRYMGLDANDINLDRFCTINNIKLKERFRIKKGRKIIYYV